MHKKKLLVFTPFSGIWSSAILDSQLINQLPPEDYEITFLRCAGLFDHHCNVMESLRIDLSQSKSQKEKICRRCMTSAKLLNESSLKKLSQSLTTDHIDNYIEPSEVETISNYVDAFSNNDIIERLQTEGINSGEELWRIALYESLLKFKKINYIFSDTELDYYRNSLRNVLLCSMAADSFFNKHSFEKALIYSPQYGICNALAQSAIRRGIKTYFIEGSSSASESGKSLRIWDWEKHGLVNPAIVRWPGYDALNLMDESSERVARHFNAIQKGVAFAYSPRDRINEGVYEHFGIDQEHKIWLISLSSFDEAFAAFAIGGFPESKYVSNVFENQFEWVKRTLEWFSESNIDKVSIVVRMHPRDLPNQREGVFAEQGSIWTSLLQVLPQNVYLDHPKDAFPIESYFSCISALITGWSSTAMDAMVRGIPVVTYDKNLPSFPSEIHLTGSSQEEYFSNLLSLRFETFDSNEIKEKCTAWLKFSFSTGVIRLDGRLQDRDFVHERYYIHLLMRVLARLLPQISQRIDLKLKQTDSLDRRRLLKLLDSNLDDLYVT
jgi:hypothetical protein